MTKRARIIGADAKDRKIWHEDYERYFKQLKSNLIEHFCIPAEYFSIKLKLNPKLKVYRWRKL